MYFVDNDTGVDAMPEVAPKQSDTVKWFTKGGGGTSPTVPGQDTWNIWQAELLNILNAAGISPDKTKLDQLATAIKSLAVSEVGIDGDVAYRDQENTFKEENTFSRPTHCQVTLHLGSATGDSPGLYFCKTAATISDFTPRDGVALNTGLDFSHSLSEGKPGWRFNCYDTDALLVMVDGSDYKVWNSGNLTPVRTVCAVKPDNTGNVKLTLKNITSDNVAFTNKVNEFIAKNTFSADVQFNYGVKFAQPGYYVAFLGQTLQGVTSGIKWTDSGCSIVGGENKSIYLESTSGQVLLYGANSTNGVAVKVDGVSHTVWNSGNLSPVRSVNGRGPDENGDVALIEAALNENGWFRDFSSGRIEQWGKTAVLSEKGNPITISFNTPFTRQCFNVQLTIIHDKSEKGNVAVYLVDAGTTSFRINLDNADEGADVAISWFAVGV
ncbi:gp53-like domain-containing protein [Klebsiella pneumoniae]|nr:hypothetical protein [Klebsiella pneumoniae]